MSLTIGFVSGGTIQPGRWVKMNNPAPTPLPNLSGSSHIVGVATAVTDAIIGVSQIGSQLPPIPGASVAAAAIGDQVRVIGPGDVAQVEAAAAIVPGNYLTTNSTGQAVVAASAGRYFGIALEEGAAGFYVPAIMVQGVAP